MKIGKRHQRLEIRARTFSGSALMDVNLSGARLTNVNLAGASVPGSYPGGMTVDGIAVTDLLATHQAATQPASHKDAS